MRTRAGQFRSAVDRDGIVAWSVPAWAHLDPDAAAQFVAAGRGVGAGLVATNVQRAFIAATGLGESAKLAASMAQARDRSTRRSHHVTSPYASRV